MHQYDLNNNFIHGSNYNSVLTTLIKIKGKKEGTYSFGNHGAPAFIKRSLHHSIICTGRTRPDYKRVGHLQPINANTQIRFRMIIRSKNLKSYPSGPSRPGSNMASDSKWVAVAVAELERSHGCLTKDE